MSGNKQNKARKMLINMYIKTLKEDTIPWHNRWINIVQKNASTNIAYKGINQLLLSFVASEEKYKDPRWLTYLQIQEAGYKLKNAKGKGIPIEFWAAYDIKNKRKVDFVDYKKIIELNPELKDNYKIFSKVSYVFNAECIDGIEPYKNTTNDKVKSIPRFIENVIKNFGIKYFEQGNQAYYVPSLDVIYLPPRNLFNDTYSYYATLLHELCHATGHKTRLNRNLDIKNDLDRAREELIAEISSSFLMQELNIDVKAEHYDNHKAYIKSWIELLENEPSELFKAINKSMEVSDYVEENSDIRNINSKNKERKNLKWDIDLMLE